MLVIEQLQANCLAFPNNIQHLSQKHTTLRFESDWLPKVPVSNVIPEEG
jgi:hypothetical protein